MGQLFLLISTRRSKMCIGDTVVMSASTPKRHPFGKDLYRFVNSYGKVISVRGDHEYTVEFKNPDGSRSIFDFLHSEIASVE